MEITSGVQDRAAWVSLLRRVAEPVLGAAAEGRLRERMPIEAARPGERAGFAMLEAVARTLAGCAPWLALDPAGLNPAEARVAGGLFDRAVGAVASIADPGSPDAANWDRGGQPLVDAAFLGQALLRCPRLFEALPAAAQANVLEGLRRTRAIPPGLSNWLLFSAMVEAALHRFGGGFNPDPVARALDFHEAWYVGDGAYGDGAWWHWDYYNAFVIQPMLVEVYGAVAGVRAAWDARRGKVEERARRFAAVQERMVGPDGSFPPLGRSLCYRCGALGGLAQSALRRDLPGSLSPGAARGALTAAIRRTLEPAGTFDAAGFLRRGLAGHQPSLAEGYISTASLYLCTAAFLPLGLGPGEAFWSDPPADWTSRRVWGGLDAPADAAMKD